jgi:hypothetical protein
MTGNTDAAALLSLFSRQPESITNSWTAQTATMPLAFRFPVATSVEGLCRFTSS